MGNWEELTKNAPEGVDLKEIKRHSRRFARLCYMRNRGIDAIKESLLEARGELEKMITLVLNYMKKSDVILNEKVTDIIYEEFSINFSGFMKQLDDKQDSQFVKVDERNISFARLIAFKIFLEISFFDLVFLPLKHSIDVYSKNKNLEEFFYNWFVGVASILKVKAGLRREGIKSSAIFRGRGQYAPYSLIYEELNKSPEEIKKEEETKTERNEIEEEWDDTFFPEIDNE